MKIILRCIVTYSRKVLWHTQNILCEFLFKCKLFLTFFWLMPYWGILHVPFVFINKLFIQVKEMIFINFIELCLLNYFCTFLPSPHIYIYIYIYGPVLVTVQNGVWLVVSVLVVAVVFVTTTSAFNCFVKSFRAHAVFEISTMGGRTQFSRIFFWRSGNMIV